MAVYENRYRKKLTGKYNKGNKARSSFPLSLAISVIIVAGMSLVVYNYHEPIFKHLASLKIGIERLLDDGNNSKAYANKNSNNSNDNRRIADKQPTPDKHITTPPPVTGENVPANAHVATPEKPIAIANPQPAKPEEAPAQPKATEQKPANISNHLIERYIDQQTGKYGLKDVTANKILVEAEYDEIQRFRYSTRKITTSAIARKGKLRGIISTSGQVLLPFEYSTIHEWSDSYPDYFLIDKHDTGLSGLARLTDGKIMVPAEYKRLESVERQRIKKLPLIIAKNAKDEFGIITMDNELMLPFEYSNISGTLDDNHLKISKRTTTPERQSLSGLVRTDDCKIIIPVEYEDLEVVGPISFIRVKKDGFFGLFKYKNQNIVPFQKVSGVGLSRGMSDSKDNRVWFSLPNGEMICYNAKGERVPCD